MAYRGNPGRPGRKLIPTRSLIDGAAIMTMAPKAPRTAAQYGRDCEKEAEKLLRRLGWTVTRSHLSRGAADLVATKLENGVLATTKLVQVKSCQVFRPTALNRGVLEILRAPPVQHREAWLYLFGKGRVVVARISPAGMIDVDGKEPYASQVRTALDALWIRNTRREDQHGRQTTSSKASSNHPR